MGADTLKGVYLPYLAPLWAVMLLDWVCFILLFNAKIKGRFFRVWLSGAGLRDFLCVLSFLGVLVENFRPRCLFLSNMSEILTGSPVLDS